MRKAREFSVVDAPQCKIFNEAESPKYFTGFDQINRSTKELRLKAGAEKPSFRSDISDIHPLFRPRPSIHGVPNRLNQRLIRFEPRFCKDSHHVQHIFLPELP